MLDKVNMFLSESARNRWERNCSRGQDLWKANIFYVDSSMLEYKLQLSFLLVTRGKSHL